MKRQPLPADEILFAGIEARHQVRGGLAIRDAAHLDAKVRQILAPDAAMDLPYDQRARLAAALIRGYAEANPVASKADRAHHRNRRLARAASALRRTLAITGMTAATASRANFATVSYAHGLHTVRMGLS